MQGCIKSIQERCQVQAWHNSSQEVHKSAKAEFTIHGFICKLKRSNKLEIKVSHFRPDLRQQRDL